MHALCTNIHNCTIYCMSKVINTKSTNMHMYQQTLPNALQMHAAYSIAGQPQHSKHFLAEHISWGLTGARCTAPATSTGIHYPAPILRMANSTLPAYLSIKDLAHLKHSLMQFFLRVQTSCYWQGSFDFEPVFVPACAVSTTATAGIDNETRH
jgi:hypothetical protein